MHQCFHLDPIPYNNQKWDLFGYIRIESKIDSDKAKNIWIKRRRTESGKDKPRVISLSQSSRTVRKKSEEDAVKKTLEIV